MLLLTESLITFKGEESLLNLLIGQDGTVHHRFEHGDGQGVRADQDIAAPPHLQGSPGRQEDDRRLRRVFDPFL